MFIPPLAHLIGILYTVEIASITYGDMLHRGAFASLPVYFLQDPTLMSISAYFLSPSDISVSMK